MSEIKNCEVCGKAVKDTPAAWAAHNRVHGGANAGIQAAQAKLKEVKATEKVDKINDFEAAAADIKFAGEREKTAYMRALASLKMAIKAPDVTVGTEQSDERYELQKVYLPDSVGKNATRSAYFGRREEVDVDISRGYVPVMNEHGQHVSHMGDPMYWTFKELSQARIEKAQRESESRLNAVKAPPPSVRDNFADVDSVGVEECESGRMAGSEIERELGK